MTFQSRFQSRRSRWLLRINFAAAIALALLTTAAQQTFAQNPQELLIKLNGTAAESKLTRELFAQRGTKVEYITDQWILYKPTTRLTKKTIQALSLNPEVEYIQPNYKIKLLEDFTLKDPIRRKALQRSIERYRLIARVMPPDNPAIPPVAISKAGPDPLSSKQWGMNDIGAPMIWPQITKSNTVTVAVIDTGVDYTHPDLVENMWRNPGESGGGKETNGIDDDNNGFVDDVMGWDFVANDKFPFDLAFDELKVLTGGNPGHGTHCAGNVGARGGNSLGISGVGPQVKIMALRFITEKGSGTTADAIKAIRYGVDMGAKVLSNSWGSEGEDPNAKTENQALRDAITYAESKGVLFIAAAGNGHKGAGYDNDTDPKPAYPATYPHSNIISVAAIDVNDKLGGFSNWGAASVDIGAPGLNVYSTTVGGLYSDKVVDLAAMTIDWDGTSMACPHVAGAAAIYWAEHPHKTFAEVKDAILRSAKPIPALRGKVVSNGKLNLIELFKIK